MHQPLIPPARRNQSGWMPRVTWLLDIVGPSQTQSSVWWTRVEHWSLWYTANVVSCLVCFLIPTKSWLNPDLLINYIVFNHYIKLPFIKKKYEIHFLWNDEPQFCTMSWSVLQSLAQCLMWQALAHHITATGREILGWSKKQSTAYNWLI
jgi:hypothetical protein